MKRGVVRKMWRGGGKDKRMATLSVTWRRHREAPREGGLPLATAARGTSGAWGAMRDAGQTSPV